MMLFRKKVTPEELAKIVTEGLPTRLVERFSEKDEIWIVRESVDRTEGELRREWIIFNMFMLQCSFWAALQRPNQFETYSKSAILLCGIQFVEIGAFSDLKEFVLFLNTRFPSYERARQNTGGLGVPVYVGMVYGESCGKGQSLEDMYGWATCFTTMTKIYRDIIDALLKEYRLAS